MGQLVSVTLARAAQPVRYGLEGLAAVPAGDDGDDRGALPAGMRLRGFGPPWKWARTGV
ncbi:hypothetical protein OHB39_32760 [Streptomyces sp. NBC_00047]|uniref:hypothetical protein n=1 Tax=Streptomyces sp. NBC_00047 TaxID=2975627 RepID=UPI00224CE235|nr:hypothetical protein [Streptomyces sp. NBC_00047]MCX5612296.1 hypothetical protein [Streptomyces sp. NBC_00047]